MRPNCLIPLTKTKCFPGRYNKINVISEALNQMWTMMPPMVPPKSSLGSSTAIFHVGGCPGLFIASVNGPSFPQRDPHSTAIHLILMVTVVEGLSEALYLRYVKGKISCSNLFHYFIHLITIIDQIIHLFTNCTIRSCSFTPLVHCWSSVAYTPQSQHIHTDIWLTIL